MIDKSLIESLKTTLTTTQENLKKELASFATEDKQIKGNWDAKRNPAEDTDMEEKADELEEYDNLLSLEHSLEKKLQAVDIALEKIAIGKYGTCEKCQKEIEQERLLAYPEGKWCVSCNK